MWKEYRPVDRDQAGLHDAEYMEQYWTREWEARQANKELEETSAESVRAYLARWVEKRAEYSTVRRHLGLIPEGARILDGGCGEGKWVLWWAAQGYQATGLDISRATISRLARTFPQHDFQCGDIRRTAFADAIFDVYTSWGTFEHFEDGLGPCFEEARRILKPGGLLFVSVPFENGRFLKRSARSLAASDKHYDRTVGYRIPIRFHQWRLTMAELHREFELHGFALLSVEAIHKRAGLHWMLSEDIDLPIGSRLHKLVYSILLPIVPARKAAHMILGVGRRR